MQCVADAKGRARASKIMGRSCTWEQNARWMKKWFHTDREDAWRQYFASYIDELGNNGSNTRTDYLNNFITPTQNQRHGGKTHEDTQHATRIVQYAELRRRRLCLTLNLSRQRGVSTASFSSSAIKAANDQWQGQTTEEISEALRIRGGADIGEQNRREC